MGLVNAILTAAQKLAGASSTAGVTPAGNLVDGSGAVLGASASRAIYRAQIQRWWSAPQVRAWIKAREDAYRARRWVASERVEVGAVRLPTAYYTYTNGNSVKIHRCVTAGVTGASEPAWATADFHVSPSSADTTDGTVVWRAYNITHLDSTRADNTGDGSQLYPYRDWRALDVNAAKAVSAFASGRAIALKRGSVFNSHQVTNGASSLARLYIKKPSGDTALFPERRTVMAYGAGVQPVIDGGGNGALQFGIRTEHTSAASHEGFLTIQDIAVTAIGGTRPGSSGAGIFAPVLTAEASPGYSTHPQGVVVLGCRVYDFRPTTYLTAADVTVNGIQTFGAYNETLLNVVTDSGDDNIWCFGSNYVCAGNRTRGAGYSTIQFPAREQGDEAQINSFPIRDNGDTPCHNVSIVGNEFNHTRPQKHVLICNPEVSGVDVLSRGYVVAFNFLKGYRGADGSSQTPLYLSGCEADVYSNVIDSGHIRGTADNSAVTCFAKIRAWNNYVIVRGDHRGFELGTNTYSYTSPLNGTKKTVTNTATGSEVFNNTIINEGSGLVGVLNWGTGVTAFIACNAVIGYPTGIQGLTGSKAGSNAFQGATRKYAGGLTQMGGDVEAVDLGTYRGVPVSASSPLIGAGTIFPEALPDDFSGQRRSGPLLTIGAHDFREVD